MPKKELLPPMSFREIPTPADLGYSQVERRAFQKLVYKLINELEANWKEKGKLGCEVCFESQGFNTRAERELERMLAQRGWKFTRKFKSQGDHGVLAYLIEPA